MEPHLLITGAVHGDEFEPVAAIQRLIEQFDSDEGLGAIFRGTVTFVPVVNEAAFLRGHRCADDGLVLARVCPGRIDGSITERTVKALSDLIESADFTSTCIPVGPSLPCCRWQATQFTMTAPFWKYSVEWPKLSTCRQSGALLEISSDVRCLSRGMPTHVSTR